MDRPEMGAANRQLFDKSSGRQPFTERYLYRYGISRADALKGIFAVQKEKEQWRNQILSIRSGFSAGAATAGPAASILCRPNSMLWRGRMAATGGAERILSSGAA